MTPIVKGHYVGDSESWSVELKDAEGVAVASVQGLGSRMDANKAGEWLQAGIAAGWCLQRAPLEGEIDAAIGAVREVRSEQKRRKRVGAKLSKDRVDSRIAYAVLEAARLVWVRSVLGPRS